MAARTQVDMGSIGFSGRVSVYSPYDAVHTPLLVSADFNLLAGHAKFEWLVTNVIPGETEEIEHVYSLTAWTDITNEDEETVHVTIPGDNSLHELGTFSVVLSDYGIECEVSDAPLGDKAGVTHSKERFAEDALIVPEETTLTVTAGEASVQEVVAGQGFGALQWNIDMISLVTDGLPANTDLILLEDLAFNGEPLNCDELSECVEGNLWVEGSGDTIRFYLKATENRTTDWEASGHAPRHYSFSGLAVRDMDDALLGDVVVTCPAVQIYDSDLGAWVPVTQSVSAWRSSDYVQSWGCYSWDSTPPPDGAIYLSAAVYLYVYLPSAQEVPLDGFETSESSSRSFAHDGRIIIEGWPLDATDRSSAPQFSDVVTITHRDEVGIYGPFDALSNTDWEPSEGATAPDANGDFTVTEPGATLTLELPSNYTNRLQVEVPAGTSPVGVPLAYIIRRSDAFVEEEEPFTGTLATWTMANDTPGLADHVIASISNPRSLPTFSFNQFWDYTTDPVLTVHGLNSATNEATAVSYGSYFEITIGPEEGCTLSLSRLSCHWARADTTNRGAFIRGPHNGYASNLWASNAGNVRPTWSQYSPNIDLSGIAYYQNLTTSVTFRFYLWQGADGRSQDIDDLTFEGTLTAPTLGTEAVYCWLGWRYLTVPLTAPEACTVTLTVRYQPLGTHDDNHLSDSTRQTTYSYTPAAEQTITRTASVEAGANTAAFDLATDDDVPLAVVTGVELGFGAVGSWTLDEPMLELDKGYGISGPTGPHWRAKWFEHWDYAEGGVSAVVDGQRCGIEWPDHYLPNTVEREVGGNFDYVVGATTGIDLSSAWSLAAWASLVEDCCDAWTVGYDSAAAEEHTVDDADNVLVTLSVLDICPDMDMQPEPADSYEDYEEVDAGDDITVSSNLIEVVDIPNNVDSYVYFDAGTNYFSGDFSHDFTITPNGGSTEGASAVCWGISNTVGAPYDWADGAYVRLVNQSSYDVPVVHVAGGSSAVGSSLTIGNTYYCTMVRTGTEYCLYVYNDEGRTSLHCYSHVDAGTAVPCRYVYAAASYGFGDGATYSFDVGDLDTGGIMYCDTYSVPCAIRVAQWTAVPAVHYDWHAVMYTQGKAHGWSGKPDALVPNGEVTIYRHGESSSEWTAIETVAADHLAYWRSSSWGPVELYSSNDASFYIYGVGNAVIERLGRFAAREWTRITVLVEKGENHAIWFSMFGILHQIRTEGNKINFRWLPYPTIQWSDDLQVADSTGSDLFIAGQYMHCQVVMAWRNNGYLHVAHTTDMGKSITGQASTALDYEPMRHCLLYGMWYTAGKRNGVWYVRKRLVSDLDFEWIPFPDGYTESEVAALDVDEAVMDSDKQGNLYLVFDGTIYVSSDLGWTWTEFDTFDPLGWVNMCGWLLGNCLILIGNDGSEWRAMSGVLSSDGLVWLTQTPATVADYTSDNAGAEVTNTMVPVVVVYGSNEYKVLRSYDFGFHWEEVE